MGEHSGIAWTHSTFNPWEGCHKVSPGCANCYAAERDKRWHDGKHWGPHAPRFPHKDSYWAQPLKWNVQAAKRGEVHRVFSASLSDVFEQLETGHPQEEWMVSQRARLWELTKATPCLTWMLLTKRPQNIARMVPFKWVNGSWPNNVWIGTTMEDQERANERMKHLAMIPALVRFVSVEPQLEPVSIVKATLENSIMPYSNEHKRLPVEWVIQGGESGNRPRAFDLDWARMLRDECAAHGVAYFFKQAGANPVIGRGPRGLLRQVADVPMNDKAGADPIEWPVDLRVQQFTLSRVTHPRADGP